jgi:hypothetical protein
MGQSYALAAWFFTRLLAAVYFVAFVSLAVQSRGLFSSKGILPIRGYLQAVEKQVGTNGTWQLPTVFWLDPTDNSIQTAAWVGVGAAVLAFFGFAQGWMFFACFVLYMSFVVAGQDFMSFQWDALLVEVGFVALFAVPWNFKLQVLTAIDPHWSVRYMFYVILFKLMFLSGVVKILSGDETWADLTALSYHYWTQPLPNPLSPFMHRLPLWVHQIGTGFTFAVELGAPFFIWWPRARAWAAFAFILLSAMIFATGNYTFFNILTIALAFWLIPDSVWERPLSILPWEFATVPSPIFAQWGTMSVMGALLIVSVIWCTHWFYPEPLSAAVNPILNLAQTFRISNSYGLFANMTHTRPEIVLEGSMDGQTWKEYEFKYKPGDLDRMPPVIAPFQPRLDWQMWFAALGTFQQTYWFQNFMVRIFEGREEVLDLLAGNPFADGPPRFLRARLYQYTFADPEEIVLNGRWWHRTLEKEYSPTIENPFLKK